MDESNKSCRQELGGRNETTVLVSEVCNLRFDPFGRDLTNSQPNIWTAKARSRFHITTAPRELVPAPLERGGLSLEIVSTF